MDRINIKLFLIVFILIGLASYFLYQWRGYLLGPQIIIEFPRPAEVVRQSFINVKGRAFNISNIAFNDRQIFIDKEGFFNEGLLLARGYNIIELTATDKFGRVKKERREVILE
jgi:hypothetical protein